MIKKAFCFLIIIVAITGCLRDPKPYNAIDRNTFIDILADVHIAESMYLERTKIKLDTLQSKPLYLSVLKKYNVTEDKMLKMTLYYSRNPKEYDKIFTEVLSKISIMTEELQGKKDESKKK